MWVDLTQIDINHDWPNAFVRWTVWGIQEKRCNCIWLINVWTANKKRSKLNKNAWSATICLKTLVITYLGWEGCHLMWKHSRYLVSWMTCSKKKSASMLNSIWMQSITKLLKFNKKYSNLKLDCSTVSKLQVNLMQYFSKEPSDMSI